MKSKNLIVYFPGYTGLPKSMFNPLLRKFRRDGFATYSVKYNLFGRGDISELARDAAKQIKSLETGYYDTVTFIGHSMGGLVARKLLYINPQAADYLITLGTPHKGVQAASRPFSWLGGKSVLQMRANSTWSQYCPMPDLPILAVTGDWDYLVRDASVEDPDGMDCFGTYKNKKNIKVPTTHIGLITGYRTYGEIYAWLVYDQFDKLDPGEINMIKGRQMGKSRSKSFPDLFETWQRYN